MMLRRLPYFALLVLCSVVLLHGQEQTVAPQPAEIAGAVSRVYKSVDGSDLRLHIFNPPAPAATSLPAIVFFFGGAWTNGSINQFTPQAKYLASRGMVAIVADYRVYGRHKTSAFEAIADAKSAIRWVRSHAGELKIDANRIAAGGGSSGGHLAAAAAVLDRFDEKNENHAVSSKPNALVLFNPAIDTGPKSATASTINGGRNLAARLGDRGEEGSPLHHLGRNLPPTLILHGKADASVPYSDVERFCEAATRLGNTCQLVGYEGAGHGFFNNTWREETMLEADRFLVALGYLKNASPAVKDVDPE